MRAQLLPLALAEEEFDAWRMARQARRRTTLPTPMFMQFEGVSGSDARRLEVLLGRHLGVPVDPRALEQDIATTSGLDRYESVTWLLTRDPARGVGLRVRGRVKAYAPPFMMLGGYLENTTSSDFRIAATARYLSFDSVGSGSELRIDGTIGSDRIQAPVSSSIARSGRPRCSSRPMRASRPRRSISSRRTSFLHGTGRPSREAGSTWASISAREAMCEWARTFRTRQRPSKPGIPGFRK